jgi:hypothetical protein
MKSILRNILIVIAIFISHNPLSAQVLGKFGTNQSTLNPNAVLEIESTSKGVLLPRLTTVQQNAMSAPSDGMLIYNTDSACFVLRRAGIWRSLCSADWTITGNANIVDGTHFLGTTNNIPLSLRVNNTNAGKIKSDGTTAIGYQSLNALTTGSNNTALGQNAGITTTTGSNNTYIGFNADAAPTFTNLSNSTAIGNGATVNVSNKIRLGNTAVTMVETYGSFTTISDKRLKTNINDNFIGLDFIKAVRPVQYELKAQKGIVYDGFIAQELDSILQKQGIKSFSGVIKPSDTEGSYYTVSYSTFVVPLVNAVKELDVLTEKLKANNEKLTAENAALTAELAQLKKDNAALKASVNKNSQDIEAIKAALKKQ